MNDNWNLNDYIDTIAEALINSLDKTDEAIDKNPPTGFIVMKTVTTDDFPRLYREDIKRVYHNKDNKTGKWHTTIVWRDNIKTTVTCQTGDTPDQEKGFAMCVCKRMFGNTGAYNEIFKEFCENA